jgi:hypothetical protein
MLFCQVARLEIKIVSKGCKRILKNWVRPCFSGEGPEKKASVSLVERFLSREPGKARKNTLLSVAAMI